MTEETQVTILKIEGHLVKVFEIPDLLTNDEKYGYWLYRKLKVGLDKGSDPALKQEKLMHEIIEAINEIRELNLKHSQIQALGASIFQIMRDNNLEIFLKKGE
jgi:hypothetical protein